jgi:hypothetical protein
LAFSLFLFSFAWLIGDIDGETCVTLQEEEFTKLSEKPDEESHGKCLHPYIYSLVLCFIILKKNPCNNNI